MSGQRYGDPQERDWNALRDDEFRGVVRSEIEEHYPEALRFVPRRLLWSEQAQWIERLRERRWIAPSWPVEMGGMGLSPLKQVIFFEEHERWGAAYYREHGVVQVGPVIMRYGTREQQDRWLPPTLRAEHHWAQGYSEPEAGSDLASLRTKARRDGGTYVISGQKIWTTLAHASTHIYILARTDLDAKPQQGISFFLSPIDAPGITVRQIQDIAGHRELCEVFLDEVVIPTENRVGEENQGWTIAKSLLGHERINVGSPSPAEYGLELLRRLAHERGIFSELAFRDRYAELAMDVAHVRDAYALYKEQIARGEEIGPDVSMLKVLSSEAFARIADLIIETAGEEGGLADPTTDSHTESGAGAGVLTSFYRARPMMIYAGSNEIQRNILATAVLGLPRG